MPAATIEYLNFPMERVPGVQSLAIIAAPSLLPVLDVLDDSDILEQVLRASGAISTIMSISLSGLGSPRAREPNKAAWLTPCTFKAASTFKGDAFHPEWN